MKRHTLPVAAIPLPQDFFGNRSSGSSARASWRKPAHRIVAVAAIGWLSMLAVQPAEAREGQPLDGIAAHVNGEAITTEQVEQAIRNQVDQMNSQLEQYRRSMLDQLINNLLLQQAARVEGLDANGYLKVKVESITVSEGKARFSRLYGRLLNQRTFTDQNGAYEFTGLPGGRVVAIAHVPGKPPVKQEKTLSDQGSPGDAFIVDLIAD